MMLQFASYNNEDNYATVLVVKGIGTTCRMRRLWTAIEKCTSSKHNEDTSHLYVVKAKGNRTANGRYSAYYVSYTT